MKTRAARRSSTRSAASARSRAACRSSSSSRCCSSCTRSSSDGLTNYDPTAMLTVFGVQVVDLQCTNLNARRASRRRLGPCIDSIIPMPSAASTSARHGDLHDIAGFGHQHPGRHLGAAAARPVADDAAGRRPANDDPNARIQRQTMLFLPLISVVYGGFLPAGLFIYWITATIFSIIQQYLIVGWGSMFPLFGWTPAFATNHTPRFPVAMPPPPDPSKRAAILTDADKKPHGGQDDPPPRTRPPGPTRETTLT